MAIFITFEDIKAWQEGRKLMQTIRQYCNRARAKRDFAWADQISRSTLSVMANIAEGHDALSKNEFIRFLGYAKRSCAETRCHLYYGFDAGYITKKEFQSTALQAKQICAQIASLIKYLRSSK
ncbi:four helix bundle protein [Candidatus Peregrinibacteria bacterium CG10_big_fil_rev_8_21_14_0_10_49_10]|nr:MAG: four helix bundle protein [Candidatus Peregrinibacteria bacterium CG10_big_fil_rev_8_21_14_0_10_49_10]